MYQKNGWVIGDKRTIHFAQENIMQVGAGEYRVVCTFELEYSVLRHNQKTTDYDNSENIHKDIMLTLQYADGSWSVISADEA